MVSVFNKFFGKKNFKNQEIYIRLICILYVLYALTKKAKKALVNSNISMKKAENRWVLI